MAKKTDILDLLKNEYFVKWILNPTEESSHYWSKWIASHPERKRDVESAIQILRAGKYHVDETMPETYYNAVLENIVNHSLHIKNKRKFISRSIWLPTGIAASISILLVALYYMIYIPSLDLTEKAISIIKKEAPYGRKLTTKLPDGTVVTLNSGTVITFPDEFTSDKREVSLSGEAFFEVEHNPSKPFYVKMQHEVVKVLGTSFNIRSYPDDEAVGVSVATGKVSYSVRGVGEVVLHPEQMASYNRLTGSLKTGRVNPLQAYGWKNKVIYFNGAGFDKVISELERWYGVKIEVKGTYEHIGTFSGEFRNESLNHVLAGLSFVYHFDFTIHEKNVLINPKTIN